MLQTLHTTNCMTDENIYALVSPTLWKVCNQSGIKHSKLVWKKRISKQVPWKQLRFIKAPTGPAWRVGSMGTDCRTTCSTLEMLATEQGENFALFTLSPEVAEANMIKLPSGRPGWHSIKMELNLDLKNMDWTKKFTDVILRANDIMQHSRLFLEFELKQDPRRAWS